MTTNETRDLDVLMHLDSFQDMTDAEIEIVIAERERRKYEQGRADVDQELYKSLEDKLIAETQAANDRAQAAFDNAVLSIVNFETVTDPGVVANG